MDLACFYQSKFESLKAIQLGTGLELLEEPSPGTKIFSISNCDIHKWSIRSVKVLPQNRSGIKVELVIPIFIFIF
jgi:hypothetical protein